MNEALPEPLEDVNVTLDCTLEEFFNGSKKTASYMRQVVALDGRSVKDEMSTVNCFLRPGMEDGMTLFFAGKGNEQPRSKPTDLHVHFKQVASRCHSNASRFERRDGKDLWYRHSMTLAEAVECKPVKIQNLDGSCHIVALDQIPSPNSVKLVEDLGMPVYQKGFNRRELDSDFKPTRGNLYIVFSVEFPSSLTFAQKEEIASILCC